MAGVGAPGNEIDVAKGSAPPPPACGEMLTENCTFSGEAGDWD